MVWADPDAVVSAARVGKQEANDGGHYPPHARGTWRARDGSIMRVRPIEVADARLIREFVRSNGASIAHVPQPGDGDIWRLLRFRSTLFMRILDGKRCEVNE